MNKFKAGDSAVMANARFGGREEPVKICRWTKVSGDRMAGWYVVKFSEGGKLLVHESRLVKA